MAGNQNSGDDSKNVPLTFFSTTGTAGYGLGTGAKAQHAPPPQAAAPSHAGASNGGAGQPYVAAPAAPHTEAPNIIIPPSSYVPGLHGMDFKKKGELITPGTPEFDTALFQYVYPSMSELGDKHPVKGSAKKIYGAMGFGGTTDSLDEVLMKLLMSKNFIDKNTGDSIVDYTTVDEFKEGLHKNNQLLQYFTKFKGDVVDYLKAHKQYQRAVEVDASVEAFTTNHVAKIAGALAAFGLRNFYQPTDPDKLTAFDALAYFTGAVYGVELIYNAVEMSSVHEDGETASGRFMEVLTNPYLDGAFAYALGVGVAVPTLANYIERGHPIDDTLDFAKPLTNFLHGKHDELPAGAKPRQITEAQENTAQNLGEVVATKFKDRSKEIATGARTAMDTQTHPMAGYVHKALGLQLQNFRRGGALSMRLLESASFSQPINTSLYGRGGIWHAGENVGQYRGELEK